MSSLEAWRRDLDAAVAAATEAKYQEIDSLLLDLRSMLCHRGDGVPTQFVNPAGPAAAVLIEELLDRCSPAAIAKIQTASFAEGYAKGRDDERGVTS